MKLELSEATLN